MTTSAPVIPPFGDIPKPTYPRASTCTYNVLHLTSEKA